MKKLIIIAILLVASSALAAPVYITQAVFTITSSAATATSNLRIAPMTPKAIGRDSDAQMLQMYLLQANHTQNLFLTKRTVVDVTDALCVWIQADQDTKLSVNSETAVMLLPSGTDRNICFK